MEEVTLYEPRSQDISTEDFSIMNSLNKNFLVSQHFNPSIVKKFMVEKFIMVKMSCNHENSPWYWR